MSASVGTTRAASHAGSWYTDNGKELAAELTEWLSEAETTVFHSRAVIAPHAGYSYSGPTAAYAYGTIDVEPIEKVFVFGPSHHEYLRGCALTQCDTLETPLGPLRVDTQTVESLLSTGEFKYMEKSVDEDEHSIEMHLPYIRHIMGTKDVGVVTVLVGDLSEKSEQTYAALFAPYLSDPTALLVFSSDFCHWGRRFSYTFYDKDAGEIYESIEALDRAGMRIIESQDGAEFRRYLDTYKNTICGRRPIGLLLAMLEVSDEKFNVKFTRYAQSSQCRSSSDSSVSYASAAVVPA